MTNTYKSSSAEQQEAEKEMLRNFERDRKLTPCEPTFSNDFSVKIDGTYKNDNKQWIFIEVYARQGTLKSGHYRKVCTDMLKLITAEQFLGEKTEKYILFGSEEAKSCFENNSWHNKAAKKFGINLEIGKLSDDTKKKLRTAQIRQKR